MQIFAILLLAFIGTGAIIGAVTEWIESGWGIYVALGLITGSAIGFFFWIVLFFAWRMYTGNF